VLATNAFGDDTVGPVRLNICGLGSGVVLVNVRAFGEGVTVGVPALRIDDEIIGDNIFGALISDCPVGLLGTSTGSANALTVGEDFGWIEAGGGTLSDGVGLVVAPPVLSTMPVCGSGVVGDFVDGVVPVGDDVVPVSDDVVPVGDDPVEPVEPLVSPLVPEDGDDPGEPEVEEPDGELAPDVSASASAGMFATADPTPNATARAPTRPIMLT
jgi:hypothetical protein